MISIEEAKKIIFDNIEPLPVVQLPLQLSGGMVLAENVYAITDIPAFHQSSMDGYAILFEGWQLHKKLKIAGEIPAGENKVMPLLPSQAVRIFTGAAMPPGADTVVMQEKVIPVNGELVIYDEILKPGNNVRPKGSEIKAGALALVNGSFLSPAAIGFLAGIGIHEVNVYAKPSVSIIVTGKELQKPGMPLQHGQVYESNSLTLTAALQQLHITDITVYRADDNLAIVKNILNEALRKTDMVLVTGGISVGDYDFVLQAATQCDVVKLFHKVKQRPGKPLYFGKKGNQPVFGLPGNPSSVLTCFYEYVIPALEKMSRQKEYIKTIRVPIAKPYQKMTGLTHFLKGLYDGKTAKPLGAQESYRLSSFAEANCLIQINETVTECREGEMVDIHLFPV